MAAGRPWGCLIGCVLTVLISIIMLIFSSVVINQTYYLSVIWSHVYGLSIFALCISIFSLLFAIGLAVVAMNQTPRLITILSGLVLLMAFLAISCGVLLIVDQNNAVGDTYTEVLRMFGNYSDSKNIASSQVAVGEVQQQYECCGVNQATDWKNYFSDKTSVPDSCCIHVSPNCGQGTLLTQDTIFLRGCAEPIFFYLEKRYNGLITQVFLLTVFAVIAGAFGIAYDRSLEQQPYQMM